MKALALIISGILFIDLLFINNETTTITMCILMTSGIAAFTKWALK